MSDDLIKRYRDQQDALGGCSDGYCVIKKPVGMHTNGGCRCLDNPDFIWKSRVGFMLKASQEMADRIEELERERDEAQINHAAWKLEAEAIQANLAKMVEALRKIANAYDINWHAGVLSRAALAELEGK